MTRFHGYPGDRTSNSAAHAPTDKKQPTRPPPASVLARDAAELATLATTIVLAATGALDAVVPLGLLLVRVLGAMARAMWEGARPEVVAFGGDTAATLLGAVGRVLHVEPRHMSGFREAPPP